MIAYFTLLVGEHCNHVMINRTLEHKHHILLMISSLLIVNALYPNVTLSKIGHRAPCRGGRALYKQRLGQRTPSPGLEDSMSGGPW